jgi:hypothetical protein
MLEQIGLAGLVKGGKFIPFNRDSDIQLSTTHVTEMRDRNPLDLGAYEGKIIVVGGHLHGDTLYRATVILSLVVKVDLANAERLGLLFGP